MIYTKADCVFEVSWEVCNKVGGIYTVIRSKYSEMMKYYKNYFLIGPYFEENIKTEFMKIDPPEDFKKSFDELKTEGINCYYGKWPCLKDAPFTILIEFSGFLYKKNEIKKLLWEDYQIDSIRAGWDFEEPLMWSYAAGMLIEKISEKSFQKKNIVAHFHEWLSGFGLLYLKKNCPSIGTIFTTHATILGRTLSSNGVDIFSSMNTIDISREIYYHNIESKHLAESAMAKNAGVFTTVSEITSLESGKFLGRIPDIIVTNGLDIEKFPNFVDISIKHISSREKIKEFLTYYFFPYYSFDIDNNIIAYTVGRFEYADKGYDLIIKTLGVVNEKLKKQKSTHTLTMIFWVPMQQYGLRLDVLENKNYYMHIKNYVQANGQDILKKITYDFISKKDKVEELFAESFVNDIRKDLAVFSRKGNPPLATHNIDDKNILVNALIQNGLLNRKEDVIKVVVEPVYLDGVDGFIDLSYYDAIIGCHIGLFPSYYEPFGYTPLESAALGVPALTTDMTGFGKFIKKQNPENKGIIVLDRSMKNEEDVINNFSDLLINFLGMSHSERINCRLKAKELSGFADWKVLIKNYIDAHNLSLERVKTMKL